MSLVEIWLGSLLKAINNISDPLKTAVKSTVIELDRKAKQTPNPWDDIFVSFLAVILGVDTTEKDGK